MLGEVALKLRYTVAYGNVRFIMLLPWENLHA